MALKGILFDLDGTLADTVPVCVSAFQSTVEHFSGLHMSEAEVVSHFGLTEVGMLAKVLGPEQMDEVVPFYLGEYKRYHNLCQRPFEGLDAVFEALSRKGIATALVTGKGPETAEISLRILGLERRAEFVEVGFPDRADKPYSLRRALERWGMEPHEAAYVGDMPSDMDAARSVGVLALGAAWAESSLLPPSGGPAAVSFASVPGFVEWVEAL
jgi:pyrophosphatase PpaX